MFEALIASISTSTLLLIAAWLGRTWITNRLAASLRIEAESKIEELKSQLQRTNSLITEVAAAGSNAIANAQGATISKKIDAIDRLWTAVLAWNQYTAVMILVACIDKDWVAKHSKDPKTRSTFEMLLGAPAHIEFMKKMNSVEEARPFVSQAAWALFSAYHSLHSFRFAKASCLVISSLNHSELWEALPERNLIKEAAPPEILAQYDSNILLGTNAFIAHVKEALLTEFRHELDGNRDAKAAAVNATAILSAAENLFNKANPRSIDPNELNIDLPK